MTYYAGKNASDYLISLITGMDTIGCSGVIVSLFLIYHGLFKSRSPLPEKIAVIGSASLLIAAIPVIFILNSFFNDQTRLYQLIFGESKISNIGAIIALLYYTIPILCRINEIENPVVRKYIRIIIPLIYAFIPGLLIDSIYPLYLAIIINWLHLPYGFESSSILYFFGNLVNLYFISKYIFMNVKIIDDYEIRDDFIKDYSITNREKDILLLIMRNFSCSQIGRQLFISKRTVEKHLQNIYKKTGLNDRNQLISLINPGQ